MTREITIAGGGLAGLSLAAALRLRQVPVTVLEAGHYPRHRVCGEFISGLAGETLEYLGIRDLLDDAILHQSLSWYDGGRLLHRDIMPEPALGISRFALDSRLKQRVEDLGGVVKSGVRVRPIPEEGLVWAAGKRSQPGTWIGLKAHVRELALGTDLEMHVGTNGYAGLAGVDDGWVNVCGLFRIDHTLDAIGQDLLPAYLAAGGSRVLADTLRQVQWREGSFAAVAGFQLGHQARTPGLLALGDAESMIPPFTGNGMSMAFQAAETACETLVSWANGTLAWQAAVNRVRTGLFQRFRRRLAVARLLHRVLLDAGSRSTLQALSGAGLLPFRSVLSLVR